jgi:hypothetical protein
MDNRRTRTHRRRLFVATSLFCLAICACAIQAREGRSPQTPTSPAASGPGRIEVRFFYSTPTSVEPTYHTAIWLEDKNGKMVKTLFVSQELSDMAYKMGVACPDWIKQAHWETMPKSDVAAVTAPTPNIGVGELSFDLTKLGVAPGTYGFRFQVHVSEQYNVLHRGALTVNGQSSAVTLETVVGPGKLATSGEFIKDVQVQYIAQRK